MMIQPVCCAASQWPCLKMGFVKERPILRVLSWVPFFLSFFLCRDINTFTLSFHIYRNNKVSLHHPSRSFPSQSTQIFSSPFVFSSSINFDHPSFFNSHSSKSGGLKMEGGGGGVVSSEKKQNAESTAAAASSYTYWVREAKQDAAPLPVPRKLTAQDLSKSSNHLGSAWNKAGTWEEKNLNKWATERIKELVLSVGSLEFSSGKAEIEEVSRCTGDAFLVTVRNKKRVGYTYEITLKVKGEWIIGEEKKTFKGNLDIAEFSFGELDDLQVEVKLNDEKDLVHLDKQRIRQDMKMFLKPLREKFLEFEAELKER